MRVSVRKVGVLLLAIMIGGGFFNTVQADRFSSTHYVIDASVANNFGGRVSSTNYRLRGSGGESIVGEGSSGSYKLASGFVEQLPHSFTVTLQPSNLQGYYGLDEPSGTVVRNGTTTTINGTLVNAPTSVAGKIGNALSFNGSSQYVLMSGGGSAFQGTSMTLEMWTKTTIANQVMTSLSKPSDFLIGINWGDTMIYDWTSGTTCKATGVTVTDGNWHHIAATLVSGVINGSTIYVDGVARKSCTWTPVAQNGIPAIGASWNGSTASQHFNGSIDHVKVFDRSLTADEIQAEYDAQANGIETGLSLGALTPGTSNTTLVDAIVKTDAAGYSLAINQNHDLQQGAQPSSFDLSEDFDTLSVGADVTTTNTPFDSLGVSGGGTPTIKAQNSDSPLRGNYAQFKTLANGYAYVREDYELFSSKYVRGYYRLDSIPTAATLILASISDVENAVLSEIAISTSGQIRLRNQASTVATATHTLVPGEWIRYELFWDRPHNTQTLRLFYGANLEGTSPSETLSGTASGAQYGQILRLGMINGPGAAMTVDMDDFASATNTWIGTAAGERIPAIGSTITTPTTWTEGTTKGLGFTQVSATGTAIDAKWSAGTKYAALPLLATTVYARTGQPTSTDVLTMRLRADVDGTQVAGTYTNVVTVTGIYSP